MLEIHALLGPKSQNLLSSHGGAPEITPEMVAAQMATGPREGCAVIRAKLGDAAAKSMLLTYLRQRMAWEASRRHWKTGEKFWQRFEGMITAALEIYIAPNRCKRCKGTGAVLVRKLQVQCPMCEGAGGREPSIRRKAEIAGMHRETWANEWEDRYALAVSVLGEWEDGADQATKKVFWK